MTILPADDFFTTSKKIAKNFLQSVVVIDDQATFDVEIEPEAFKEAPKERGVRNLSLVEPEENTLERVDLVNEVSQSEALYVKQLNDCFADQGLICGVLKPTEDEIGKIAEKADHIARRADIIVFDWFLSKAEKPGETALKSILSIIKSDINDADGVGKRSRMRLVAIYTSFIDLKQVVDETKQFLQQNDLVLSLDAENHFTLLMDGVKIVFYRKNRGTEPTAEVLGRTVSESELIDCLIEDFTKMTFGLLSNVALDSLGALRNNTHRILRKFERRLDPAYVAHRTMVTPSNEAQQHPVPLLTSEFNDVLEDCEVDRHTSLGMIKSWIDHQIANKEIVLAQKVQDLSDQQLHGLLMDLIENGVDSEHEKYKNNNQLPSWKAQLNKGKKDSNSAITNLLVTDNTGDSRNLDFAMLTTLRSRYEKPEPLLTLGTIVALDIAENEEYFVCLQPLCDSVRLKGDTVFPFIRLHDSEKLEGGSEKIKDKFGVVIRDRNEYRKLRPVLKPRDIFLCKLLHQPKEEIRATKQENGTYSFVTVGQDVNLRWIGDLKFPHAQRIANDFAREISRVGLVESDWLRRMGS